MALTEAQSFEVSTRNPAIVVELHKYTKLAGDTSGTITRTKGRKIRRIVAKSDAGSTAAIAAGLTTVSLTGLATTGNESLIGFVAVEVERI